MPATPVLRSILNPSSSSELSSHARLIWLEEAAVAVRFEGASGGVLGAGELLSPVGTVIVSVKLALGEALKLLV